MKELLVKKKAVKKKRKRCKYCGSENHDFIWCVRRRRRYLDLAIYSRQRVEYDDRALGLNDLPYITED